ncbi:MAG: DUF5690 family protein [Polyangiaceae bacterium]|nr:DUF5690 family protein [Polyangiaceae bacterium]
MLKQLHARLQHAPPVQVGLYAGLSAFAAYFAMYGFRKPYLAATYPGDGPFVSELTLKTTLILSQLVGYGASKYLGSQVLPTLERHARPLALFALVGISWLSLLVFAFSSPIVQAVCLFINGLGLGMVWGLVVSYLEGRRSSEVLLAMLSCSFILASGAVKDLGRYLMQQLEVPASWMPVATGACFILPFIAAVSLLHQVPEPSKEDRITRSPRSTMNPQERWSYIKRHGLPLVLLLGCYLFLTAYRDYRDNYGVEIFAGLGYQEEPTLFLKTELPVALLILGSLALLAAIRNNSKALIAVFALMSLGLLLLPLSSYLYEHQQISGLTWMMLTGVGSYFAYVPFGSVLFDRWMAFSRSAGTAVFGIYLADAIGYTGSVGVQLYADLRSEGVQRLEFFREFTLVFGWLGAGLFVLAGALIVTQTPLRNRSAQ